MSWMRGVLITRVWMLCDTMMNQGMSLVAKLSGRRFETQSKLQGTNWPTIISAGYLPIMHFVLYIVSWIGRS